MNRKIESPVLLFLIGVMLLVYGFKNMAAYHELKTRCDMQTTAQINYVEKKHISHSTRYVAYAEFTVDDKEYILETKSSKVKYPTGKIIRVMYDESKPSVNYSPEYPPNKGILWILIGVGELLISILRLISANRDKKSKY